MTKMRKIYKGDGKSIETAFHIIGCRNQASYIHYEYKKIEELFGRRNSDWSLICQGLISCDGKYYDEITIAAIQSTEYHIWIEVSEFFVHHEQTYY